MKRKMMLFDNKPDDNTLLLLHFNDSIKDYSRNNYACIPHGISYTDGHFGKAVVFNQSYIEVSMSNPFVGDFTVDWWEYITGVSATRFAWDVNGGAGGIVAGGSSNKNYLYVSSNGLNWNIINGPLAFSTTLNQWVHWALVRMGNNWYIFRNGTLFWQGLYAGVIYTRNSKLIIGSFLYDSNHYLDGRIDEFRISNVPRWISNFTPSTRPY